MAEYSFDPFEMNSEYSPMGRNFGNPMMNMFMHGMFGNNLMPARDDGQSMHEAMLQRMRSANFMNLQVSQFANNPLFSRLGIAGSPYAGVLGGALGSPNGMMAGMMSPAIGGNPMAATMQTYAGLTGTNTMGAFGGMSNISAKGAESVMTALTSNFYKGTQSYSGPGGYQQEAQKEAQQFLKSRFDEGETGKKYLRDLGFTGSDKEIESKISNYDITSDKEMSNFRNRQLSKKMKASRLSSELDELDDTQDKSSSEVRKAHKKFKDKVVKEYNLDEKDVTAAIGKDDKFDSGKMRDLISRSSSTDDLEALSNRISAAKQGKGRITNINFENTRGFKLEDFTSGFNRAADLRMLGDSAIKGTSPAAAMRGFSANSGGTLDAARSLFGNKSGGELVKDMSDLAGGSSIDLSSREGSAKMEELLRKAKATARVAGVSVKTMLGIIQASKDLAQNNPQLQHMNEGATTHLALNAITKASAQGSRMSSQDFRTEGGSQGMASGHVQEGMRYAQSNMGQARAAILAAFHGDPEKYEAVKKILAKNLTAEDLNRGGIAEIAKVTGRSVSDVYSMSQSKTLASEGLKVEDIAKTVTDTAQASAYKSFFAESPMNQGQIEQDYRKHKEAGGTDLDFVNSLMSRGDISEQRRQLLGSSGYRQSIMQGLRDSTLTEEEKNAHTARVAQSAKDDEEISRKYASANAPVITQMLSALSEGKSPKETTEALTHIFATDNVDLKSQKDALEAAQTSSKGLISLINKSAGTEQAIKGGAVGKINELTQNIKTSLGDSEAGKKIQNIGEADLRNMLDAGKDLHIGSAKEARARLNDLEQQVKDKNINPNDNPEEYKALRALRGWQAVGAIDDDEAVEDMQKGTLSGVTAGILRGVKDRTGKAKLKEIKDAAISNLDKELAGSKDQDKVKELRAQYGEGIKGTRAIFEAFDAGEGAFSQNKNWEGVGRALQATQTKLSDETDKATSSGQVNQEDKFKHEMLKAMEGLTKSINSGGGFTSLIDNLAKALRGH